MRYIALQSKNKKPFQDAIMYRVYEAESELNYTGTWNEDELIADFELDLEGSCKHGDFFIGKETTIMIVNIDNIQGCIDREIEMFYKNNRNN